MMVSHVQIPLVLIANINEEKTKTYNSQSVKRKNRKSYIKDSGNLDLGSRISTNKL